jgi:hypothetical protein
LAAGPAPPPTTAPESCYYSSLMLRVHLLNDCAFSKPLHSHSKRKRRIP